MYFGWQQGVRPAAFFVGLISELCFLNNFVAVDYFALCQKHWPLAKRCGTDGFATPFFSSTKSVKELE